MGGNHQLEKEKIHLLDIKFQVLKRLFVSGIDSANGQPEKNFGGATYRVGKINVSKLLNFHGPKWLTTWRIIPFSKWFITMVSSCPPSRGTSRKSRLGLPPPAHLTMYPK